MILKLTETLRSSGTIIREHSAFGKTVLVEMLRDKSLDVMKQVAF